MFERQQNWCDQSDQGLVRGQGANNEPLRAAIWDWNLTSTVNGQNRANIVLSGAGPSGSVSCSGSCCPSGDDCSYDPNSKDYQCCAYSRLFRTEASSHLQSADETIAVTILLS